MVHNYESSVLFQRTGSSFCLRIARHASANCFHRVVAINRVAFVGRPFFRPATVRQIEIGARSAVADGRLCSNRPPDDSELAVRRLVRATEIQHRITVNSPSVVNATPMIARTSDRRMLVTEVVRRRRE